MQRLINWATQHYDNVIIDAPPLLPVTDAAVLSKVVSGTLIIAGARKVQRGELEAAIDSLDRVDARVLGIVLNMVQQADSARYAYRYSYEQAYPPKQSAPVAEPSLSSRLEGRRTPARALRVARQ